MLRFPIGRGSMAFGAIPAQLAHAMRRLVPRAVLPRLGLALLVATAPMLAVLFLSALADGARVVDAARERLVLLARLAAEQQDDTLQEASNLLRVLGKVPAIRLMQDTACAALLHDVVADHPRVSAIALARPDGQVVCGSRPIVASMTAQDRPYFQEALLSDGSRAVLSSLVVSRITGQPTMFVALPILSPVPAPSGRTQVVASVLIASLNLDWFARLGDRGPAFQEQLVQVLDSRDGAVLARTSDFTARIGDVHPDHPVLLAAKASPGGGSVVARDVDGVLRIFGFAPLPGRAGGLVIAIGIPEAGVRQAADQRFGYAMLVAMLATGFGVLVTWRTASRLLLRPIGSLVLATQRLGAGDLMAQPSIDRGAARELGLLNLAFIRMGRRLCERDARIAAMQAQIAASEIHHRLLADAATDVITRFDPMFRRVYVSPVAAEVLAFQPRHLLGRHMLEIVHPDDRKDVQTSLMRPLLDGQATARGVYRVERGDGRTIWIESSGRRLEDGSGFVFISRDVSERKALQAELEEANRQLSVLVRQDPLTGLGNRRHFDDTLGTEYRRAIRMGWKLAMVMIDVDRFKAYNDAYGHPAGDACLQAIASALAGALRRPADLAARYGGEEFALLLPNTDEAGAQACAARLHETVANMALVHAGSEYGTVTISLGIAVIAPRLGGAGPASLVEAADTALYEAKRAGRNTSRIGTVTEGVA